MGLLTYEDIMAHVLDQGQSNEENVALVRRILAFLRTPGTIERLKQLDTPGARALLDLARRVGLDGPDAPGEPDEQAR
jgi:hypothetical protein